MDLQQQVKNFQATQRQAVSKQEQAHSKEKLAQHGDALQALSNGLEPPYEATLAQVQHGGSRVPKSAPAKSMKPPGYCRNAVGGFYTS